MFSEFFITPKCEALAKSTVNSSDWSHSSAGTDCKQNPCAISNNQPQPQGHFYAMSGFFVVFKFFNISSIASDQDRHDKDYWHVIQRQLS